MAQILEIIEVTAISRLSVTASWDGTTARTENATAVYNPPSGWAILEAITDIHSSNNGNRSVSVADGGLNIVSEQIIDEIYDSAIEVAGKANNKEAEAKLKEKKAKHKAEVFKLQTNKNTVLAQVWATAHGSMFDRKRGWEDISVRTKLIYLGANNPNEIAASLEAEFLIDIPNFGI